MAMHFAWDFTNSSIFQISSVSEASLFVVKINETPDLSFDLLAHSWHNRKNHWLIIVVLWIKNREGKIRTRKDIAKPSLRLKNLYDPMPKYVIIFHIKGNP